MTHYSQYGEEVVIDSFFNKKKNGFCVDVGAADGILYSNSRYLIETLEWNAVLVEPHPTFFSNLQKLYEEDENITLINSAVYNIDAPKMMPFYVYGREVTAQVSTLSEKFKQRVITAHGDKYEDEPMMVRTTNLNEILKPLPVVDFLSIDCEGVDMEVLMSNDWEINRPELVCIEQSMKEEVVVEYMKSIQYKTFDKTFGNIFFKKENE